MESQRAESTGDVQSAPSTSSPASSFALSKLLRTPSGRTVVDPSSVHHFESGRTYHFDESKYFFPNDGPEQDRLDLQHWMIYLLFDERLSLLPFKRPPERVLDVATGTGIWAWEFAEKNPSSYVIGFDISKIQPHDVMLPNLEYLVDDAEKEWVFDNPFDYIHLRFVFSCFSDPKKVMRSAFDNLKPGGWIEYQDTTPIFESDDGSHKGQSKNPEYLGPSRLSTLLTPADTVIDKVCHLFNQAFANRGRDPFVTKRYAAWLRELGFVDVTEKKIPVPVNKWPDDPKWKLIGEYCTKDLHDGIRGIAWKMLSSLGIPALEIEELVLGYQRDIQDTNIRAVLPCYVVSGRKPFDGEGSSVQSTQAT